MAGVDYNLETEFQIFFLIGTDLQELFLPAIQWDYLKKKTWDLTKYVFYDLDICGRKMHSAQMLKYQVWNVNVHPDRYINPSNLICRGISFYLALSSLCLHCSSLESLTFHFPSPSFMFPCPFNAYVSIFSTPFTLYPTLIFSSFSASCQGS